MKSLVYDYEKEIPAGFYDKIYQRKAGVRYCWHDLKFRAVAAHPSRAKRLLDIGCYGRHAADRRQAQLRGAVL